MVLDSDMNAYVVDIFRDRGLGNNALIDKWGEYAQKWAPSQIVIENAGGARGIVMDAQARHMLPFMLANPARSQKGERFGFVCARAEAGKVFFDKSLPDYTEAEEEKISFLMWAAAQASRTLKVPRILTSKAEAGNSWQWSSQRAAR